MLTLSALCDALDATNQHDDETPTIDTTTGYGEWLALHEAERGRCLRRHAGPLTDGLLLTAAREAAGLERGDVARLLGVRAETVGNWEHPETTYGPTRGELHTLCDLYRIAPDDVLRSALSGREAA